MSKGRTGFEQFTTFASIKSGLTWILNHDDNREKVLSEVLNGATVNPTFHEISTASFHTATCSPEPDRRWSKRDADG